MSTTQTYAGTTSDVFTIVHAKYLASKVTADLTRCRQLYGYPATLEDIDRFGTELALWLQKGYVSRYEFGFKKDEKRILSWQYEIKGSTIEGGDQRPGGLQANVDISGASSFNYLTWSPTFEKLSAEAQATFKTTLPFSRQGASPPLDGAGNWVEERSYSAAGTLVTRRNFRPL